LLTTTAELDPNASPRALRILAYLRGFPGEDDYQRDFTTLLVTLAHRGNDVTVLSAPDASRLPLVHRLIRASADSCEDVRTYRGPIRLPHGLTDAIDIFLGVEWWNPMTHILARQAIRRGIPAVIATWDSLSPFAMAKTNGRRTLSLLGLRRFYGPRLPALQFFSPPERAAAVAHGWTTLHFYAPLGIYDYPGHSPAFDWAPLLTTSLQEHERVLLFNGRLDVYRKGLDLLLGAYARVEQAPDWRTRLVISGRLPRAVQLRTAARTILSRVAELRTCTFVGELDDQARRDAIAHASAFIYPSRHDGPPRPLRESLSRGTPVVVTGETGFGEVVREEGAGVVVLEPSIPALIDALLKFNNASDYDLQGWREGATRAARRLTWGCVADMYERGLRLITEHEKSPHGLARHIPRAH
jgi:glycosyltransferase involved in cell wall biosynthesis